MAKPVADTFVVVSSCCNRHLRSAGTGRLSFPISPAPPAKPRDERDRGTCRVAAISAESGGPSVSQLTPDVCGGPSVSQLTPDVCGGG